jgi:two-component system, cell cycle response regulator DivK
MDIKMPVMGGIEATQLIKKISPDIPVIAQTAYALDHEVREYKKKGFDDYLTKPIEKDELINKVLKYIKKNT